MFLILFLKIGFPCHGSKIEFVHLVRVGVCCSSGELQSIPFSPFSPLIFVKVGIGCPEGGFRNLSYFVVLAWTWHFFI